MSSKISNMCRTCMQCSSKLWSVWASFEETVIAQVVTECTGVQIVEDNDLPNQICCSCLNELRSYVRFCKTTRESNERLTQMFKMKTENNGEIFEKPPDIGAIELLEIQIDTTIKDEPSDDCQSDYDDDLQDQDYVMEQTPQKKKRKRSVRKPKYEPSAEADIPDEVEKKTFETIQIKEGQLICCSCFQDFSNQKDLEQHVTTSHKTNLLANSSQNFICDICFRGYSTQQALKTHKVRIQGISSLFACKCCNYRCTNPSTRRTHAWAHNKPEAAKEELGFICCAKKCSASFPTEELLLQHAPIAHKADKIQAELALHNKALPVQCNICYARFSNEKSIVRHRNRMYLPKRHQCPTCGEGFHRKKNLELHEGNHLKEKNVVCEICTKRFVSQAKLQQHLSYHAAKPRFVCDLCGKVFKKSSSLQAHMLAHEGKLPFVCEVCSKAFAFKIRLVYHMRTHTGEAYPCKYCDSRFTTIPYLRRHEKKKHLEEIARNQNDL